jgi:hypothetical protein
MNCLLCGQSILVNDKTRAIELLLRDRLGSPNGLPKLYYHEECFYEVAGSEYKGYFEAAEEDFGLSANEMQLVNEGQVIQAIKEHRVRTGSGLKEAKDIVDKYRAEIGHKYG